MSKVNLFQAREDEEHKQMTNACSYSNGASGVTFPAISQHSDNEQVLF